tara:strand:- start:755 stop:916 length:162 start_codon:yes stop_codon:yes gene_type:complete
MWLEKISKKPYLGYTDLDFAEYMMEFFGDVLEFKVESACDGKFQCYYKKKENM